MNERLQQIRMVQMDTCRKCTMKDTLEHRITACGEGRDIWEHSRSLIAQMLRTTPSMTGSYILSSRHGPQHVTGHTLDAGTGHTVLHPTNTNPNITELHGLPAEVKVEADLL